MLRSLFALVAFFLALPLLAQVAAINGRIEGTVTDPSGAAIAGATVRLSNPALGLEQTATTNDAGLYRFPLLPLGTYRLTVEASGFAASERNNIVINAGVPATVNVALGLGNQKNTVVVTDAAPVIDPSRTDLGSTLSRNAVANLPLVSRNPFNFILIQPNVAGRPNTEFGVPRKINANGFVNRINYQVDGMNNTESDRAGLRLMPFSNTFIGEVQTVNNGFSPEFGNTVGTVFNTITKSGDNDYHGEGAYLFRRTDFSARPKLLRSTAPTPDTNVDTFFGNVGSHIVKNKLFYFAGVERVRRDLPQVVTVTSSNLAQLGLPASFGDAIPFSQTVLFYLGKLDYQINEKNRLSVRFNGHRNDSPYNNGGALTVVSQTYNFIDRSYAGAVQLISSITSSTVNELRVQVPYRLQRNLPFELTGTGPSISIAGVANFGGSPSLGFLYKEVTPEVTDNLTQLIGRHSIKAGFSYRSVLDRQTQANAATYNFASIATYRNALNGTNPRGYTNYTAQINQPSITYNSNFYSGYVQDEWKPRPNVTLNYGVRYDLYSLPGANSASPYLLSRNFRVDKNNVAPRIGIAIGLGQDQKTVLRASGGIFYDPPQTDVYRTALLQTGAGPLINYTAGPTATFAPLFPNVPTNVTPSQNVATVSPNFATLYSGNANVSISREINANTGVTVSYLFTRGNRLPIYRNINLLTSGSFLADGRPIYQQNGFINTQFNNILLAESVGQSVYHGLNVTFRRRLSSGFELFGTYTWSHAIDDAPEQNNVDSAALLPSDPSNRRRDRGNSLTDRRHAFTAQGLWQPTFNLQPGLWNYLLRNNKFSSIFVAYAGDIFNIGSNQPLNRDLSIPNTLQRPLYIGRNTYRGPATYQMDLRYTRLFPIRERVVPEFFGEFTNIFNHNNINNVNSTATVNTAGAILTPPSFAWTGALDQRLVQIGVRVQF